MPDVVPIAIPETHSRTSIAVQGELGRLDSNQDYQGQNLACCQLHYGPRASPNVPGLRPASGAR